MSKTRFREIIVILLILLAAKFGINYCYDNDLFSIDHIKYNHYVNNLEDISPEQLDQLLHSPQENITIIYMGRETCPVCVELLPQISTIFETYVTITRDGQSYPIEQYYFDSEKNQTSLAKQLREELQANTVPVIIIINGDNISLFNSDSLILNDYLTEFERYLTL